MGLSGERVFSATAHAAWLALTACWPFHERFALISDIKLARNWVDADENNAAIPQFNRLDGATASLIIGAIGLEFEIDQRASLSLLFDGFGESADAVETDLISVNYSYHF